MSSLDTSLNKLEELEAIVSNAYVAVIHKSIELEASQRSLKIAEDRLQAYARDQLRATLGW